MTEAIRRCVIADDVRAWREVLSVWLSEWGYECISTIDGNEAMVAVEAAPTHLLVTDIEMPRCSGLELITRIRKHARPELHRMPVIVISSLLDDELDDVVGSFGGDCLFTKPLDRTRVHSAVKQLELGEKIVPLTLFNNVQERVTSSKAISPKLRRLAEEAIQKGMA